MSEQDKNIDDVSGVETTGHSWDGIQELNNPLPRWWLYTWYLTIIGSVIYMILMPAIPGLPGLGSNTPGVLGQSDRAEVSKDLADLQNERKDRSAALLVASLEEIETDRQQQQFALAMGESAFGDNCATCHGAGGAGVKGYPSLADDVWLWDGTLEGIEYTLRHGIRHESDAETRFSLMPAFGRDGLLNDQQIEDLTYYVMSLSGAEVSGDVIDRAAPIYQQQCSTCHGVNGTGDRLQGAPNLTDQEWLFGGSRQDIQATIYNARNSHMPAWDDRLDDATIKALAVYVHTLGKGE